MDTNFKFQVLPVETDGDAGSKGVFIKEPVQGSETMTLDILPHEDGGDAGCKGIFHSTEQE